MFHRCKTHGKRICFQCFMFTASFPAEHFVWEKLPLFRLLPPLLGLK